MKIEIGNGGVGSGIITLLIVGFFIPEVLAVVVVLFLVFGFLDCLMGASTTHAASAKVQRNVPVISPSSGVSSLTVSLPLALRAPRVPMTSPPDQMSLQDQESGIRGAIEKAKRISHGGIYEHDERRRIFQEVFLRECQQRGIKVSEFQWKRREPAAEKGLPTGAER